MPMDIKNNREDIIGITFHWNLDSNRHVTTSNRYGEAFALDIVLGLFVEKYSMFDCHSSSSALDLSSKAHVRLLWLVGLPMSLAKRLEEVQVSCE